MPKYKLTYFDHRTKAEVSRLLFAAAKVPYEDFRIPVKDIVIPDPMWPDIKKKTLFGQVPILEVDGKQLAQCHAIERYLAAEFGMAGETSWEKAQVDMWVEAGEELFNKILIWIAEMDAEKRKELGTKIFTETMPIIFGRLEKELTNNKTGFIVGKKLTVADLTLISLKDWLRTGWGHEAYLAICQYPAVKEHIGRISDIPVIAEYLRTRPFTDY